MQLKHKDLWRAIDRLAEKHGLSASGLARKAGLSPTVFNASKRASRSRKRWPSTESIAHILRATNTNLEDFTVLATDGAVARAAMPLLRLEDARKNGAFDEDGLPAGNAWEEFRFPGLADAQTFALEISGKSYEPVYRDGDRIILSPDAQIRRSDRIALRTVKGEIVIGQLTRETARGVEIAPFGAKTAPGSYATREIDWMHRIIWASQ
ncbi:MAG: helix-turn-helix transcriptional regulator [Alphaproteobacteria bacterium]|nr:helix-turn-helix transcriptional regulator [Alphaproteobacteria bacterium]